MGTMSFLLPPGLPADALRELERACVAGGPDPTGSAAQAQETLALAFRAAEELVRVYLEQVFQIRGSRQPRLDTAFGCRLGSTVPQGTAAEALVASANAVCLPFSWDVSEPS